MLKVQILFMNSSSQPQKKQLRRKRHSESSFLCCGLLGRHLTPALSAVEAEREKTEGSQDHPSFPFPCLTNVEAEREKTEGSQGCRHGFMVPIRVQLLEAAAPEERDLTWMQSFVAYATEAWI